MAVNLLAICRGGAGLVVKRVKITTSVQDMLDGVFSAQEEDFFRDVTEEINFDGGWRPEKNELLVVQATDDVVGIWTSALGNVTALPELNSENFANEGIRALAVLTGQGDGRRLLLQNFSARQLLDRRVALIWDGDTFNRLTDPAFSIGSALSGVICDGVLKFKSFSNIKMIFDLRNLYEEASNVQVELFAENGSVTVSDLDGFKNASDQVVRKLIHAVLAKGVLDNYDVTTIAAAAQSQQFELTVIDNRIVFPSDRAGVKRLMHFLDEGLYRGPLSGYAFITNSKRLA